MKKTIIAFGCLMFFASGWALGQTRERQNGLYWKKLGSSDFAQAGKAMYIDGFFAGYQHGIADAETAALTGKTGRAKQAPIPEASKRFVQNDAPLLAWMSSQLRHGRFDFSNGQIESEMDSFYGDYRNAPVCWDEALVFSLGALEGNPPSRQQLSFVRKLGAGTPCP